MGKHGGAARGGVAGAVAAAVAERKSGSQYQITKSANADSVVRALLGRRMSDTTLAKLSGAQPGAQVRVLTGTDREQVNLIVHSPDGSYNATRILTRAPDGAIIIKNFSLQVNDPGHGLGSRILATQVKAASRLGIARLVATGARNDEKEPKVTGYKAWIGLGYDAPIPSWFHAMLPAALQSARSMLDVYRTPAGQALWAKEGQPIDVTFDLHRGSRSRQVLASRLREKGIAWSDL